MKISQKLQVKNRMGLHTRPATAIVKMLRNSKCDVFFSYKGETINAKSILGILMLAAQRNAKITVTADGEDAEQTMQILTQGFETGFDEKFL